jgi:hypothetical protein
MRESHNRSLVSAWSVGKQMSCMNAVAKMSFASERGADFCVQRIAMRNQMCITLISEVLHPNRCNYHQLLAAGSSDSLPLSSL